jgi:hypothetical protein
MKLLVFVFLIFSSLYSQEMLKITGAYNYNSIGKVRQVAIVVTGSIEMMGDPDDIRFVDALTGKLTPYSIDDFCLMSNNRKEFWINLPEGYNRSKVTAVFIVGMPEAVKKVKLSYDGKDISDSAVISGSFSKLPQPTERIRHKNKK